MLSVESVRGAWRDRASCRHKWRSQIGEEGQDRGSKLEFDQNNIKTIFQLGDDPSIRLINIAVIDREFQK